MSSVSARGPYIQVEDALGRRTVAIDKPVFRIGRGSQSDLRTYGTDVSRDHAEIILQPDGNYLLKDRGASCGTFVNDLKVMEHQLRPGDCIRLGHSGSSELVFLLGGTADASTDDIRPGVWAARLDRLRGLGSPHVLELVLCPLLDSALDATGADRGCVLLANKVGKLEFILGRERGGVTLPDQSFAITDSIPHEVLATNREQTVAAMRSPSGSVVCLPLRVRRYVEQSNTLAEPQAIGVLYLDISDKAETLSAMADAAVKSIAWEISSAIESTRLYREAVEKVRLDHELELASEIQRALLPDGYHSGAQFEVAARSIPCRAIGGDFFDYFVLPDGYFAFVLGDVSGKGTPAALLTAMIQGIFAAHVTSMSSSPAALMSEVNRTVIRRSPQSSFVTVMFGIIAPNGTLTYSNAGHNPPILFKQSGVRRLETGGLILGMFPDARYEDETVQLEPGDTLVVFTDGVTESFNAEGNEFGEERLTPLLEALRTMPPASIVDDLLSTVRTFAGAAPQTDDMTALALSYGRHT